MESKELASPLPKGRKLHQGKKDLERLRGKGGNIRRRLSLGKDREIKGEREGLRGEKKTDGES